MPCVTRWSFSGCATLKDGICKQERMAIMIWHKWPDEKPPEDGAYLIYAPSADPEKPLIATAWYNSACDGWSLLPIVWINAIRAWMFLPDPPEGLDD